MFELTLISRSFPVRTKQQRHSRQNNQAKTRFVVNYKTFIVAGAKFSLVLLFCLFLQTEVFPEEQGKRQKRL